MPRQRIHHTRETHGFPDDFPERLVRLRGLVAVAVPIDLAGCVSVAFGVW